MKEIGQTVHHNRLRKKNEANNNGHHSPQTIMVDSCDKYPFVEKKPIIRSATKKIAIKDRTLVSTRGFRARLFRNFMEKTLYLKPPSSDGLPRNT